MHAVDECSEDTSAAAVIDIDATAAGHAAQTDSKKQQQQQQQQATVRANPHTIVLFDEIDVTFPEVSQ